MNGAVYGYIPSNKFVSKKTPVRLPVRSTGIRSDPSANIFTLVKRQKAAIFSPAPGHSLGPNGHLTATNLRINLAPLDRLRAAGAPIASLNNEPRKRVVV